MSLESSLYSVVGPLIGNRVYPDIAPGNATRPYAVYQQVGGQVINPLNGDAPGLRHARVQIIVWHTTRAAASTLMQQIEDALRAAPLSARPEGALIARYDEHSELRGAMQDFSVWHA